MPAHFPVFDSMAVDHACWMAFLSQFAEAQAEQAEQAEAAEAAVALPAPALPAQDH